MTKDTTKAHTFISENSKLNEAGDARSMTQSAYLTFMQDQHMLTPETVKAVAAAEKDLVSGAIKVATEDLSKLITAAKKSGEDPAELSASVRISRPNGPLSTDVRAERTTTNPATGEKIVHHGVVSVKARTKAMIDVDAAKTTETHIAKLLGVK